jgi:hypothetical protein
MDSTTLLKLSGLGQVVYCFVQDHVMFSRASGWRNRDEIWSVVHDCEKGRYHLKIDGIAPLPLEEIHRRLVAEQEEAGGEKSDVDFIHDVPSKLAKALTGFPHDQDMPGMSGNVFGVLERANKESLGFNSDILGRFFGRKRDQ